MIILPAVVLGGIVAVGLVFFLGFAMTRFILVKIGKNLKVIPAHDQGYEDEGHRPSDWTNAEIDKTSALGGVVVAGLVILLAFSIKNEWGVFIWIVLVLLGIFTSVFSFAFFGSFRNPSIKAGPGPTNSTRVPPHSKNNYSKSTNMDQSQTGHDHQEFTIVVCNNCSQKLRIPKRNEKLIITCPKCKYSFPYGPNGISNREKLKQKYHLLLKKIRSLEFIRSK